MTAVTEVMVSGVQIVNRARRDLGDLSKLAGSIAARGLLNPIILDPDHILICGHRRLEAVKLLGKETILARVVDTLSDTLDALLMESDENELREPFKPSEAIAMKEMIEEKFAKEAKASKEWAANGGKSPKSDPSVEFYGRVTDSAQETRNKTAKAVGFGSWFTMKQAQQVVDKGAPELVDLMDRGEISINAASHAATLPIDEQRDAIRQGVAAVKEAAKTAKTVADGKRTPRGKPAVPPMAPAIVGPPPQMSARVQRVRIRSALDSIFPKDPDAIAVLQEIKSWVDAMLETFLAEESA